MPRLAELAWGFVLWRERENGASLQRQGRNGGGGRDVSMTSPAAAGLGPDGPASHLPGRHSSDSGSFKLIKNLLVTAHWDGRSPQRRNRSFVPRKRSGGEHRFYYPKRKAPPKSAFGVSFLRCDVTFSTPHHITHRKPKPPSIRKNRACGLVSPNVCYHWLPL